MNIIAGFLTGVTASMGLGGGFILIIYLMNFAGSSQIEAGGVNLLFFLPIAAISMIIHTKNKLIDWKRVPIICIAGVLGVLIGVWFLNFLDEKLLTNLFSFLLIIIGIREVFHKSVKKSS